jgi:hypothetical protein
MLSDEDLRQFDTESTIIRRWGKQTIELGELFDHPLIKAGGIDGTRMRAYSIALDAIRMKDPIHGCIPLDCSNLAHRHILQLALFRQNDQYDALASQLPREDQEILCQFEACMWKIHNIQAQKMGRDTKARDAIGGFVNCVPGGIQSVIFNVAKAGMEFVEAFQDPTEPFSPHLYSLPGLSVEQMREIFRHAGVKGPEVDAAISHAFQDQTLDELRPALEALGPKIQNVVEVLQKDIQDRQHRFEQERSEQGRIEAFQHDQAQLEGMINNVQYSCVIASSIANVVFKNPRLASKIDIIGNAVTEGLHLACRSAVLGAFPLAAGSPVLAFASIGLGVISRLTSQKQAAQQNRVMQQAFSQIMQGMQTLQKTMNAGFKGLEQLGRQQITMLRQIDKHVIQVSKQIEYLSRRVDFQLRCINAQIRQQALLAQNFEEISFGKLHDENRALMTRLCAVEELVRAVQQEQIYQNYCQVEALRRQQRNSWYQQTAQAWNNLELLFLHMGNRIHSVYRALHEHLPMDPLILSELWDQMINVLTSEAYREPVNGSRYLRGDISIALGDQIFAQLRGKIFNAQFCSRFLFPHASVMNRSVWEHMAQLVISFFSALEQSPDIRDKFVENREIQAAICKIRVQVDEEQRFTLAVAESIPKLRDQYLDSVRAVVECSRQTCQAEVARLTDDRAREAMAQARRREIENLQVQQRGFLEQQFTLPSQMEDTVQKFQHSHVSDKEMEEYTACLERWREKHARQKARAPVHAAKHHPAVARHMRLEKEVDKIEKKRPHLERKFHERIERQVRDLERQIIDLRSGRCEPHAVAQIEPCKPMASMLLGTAHTVTSPLYQKLLELDDNYCMLSASIVYVFQTSIQELSSAAPERVKALFGFLEISDSNFIKTRGEFVSRLMAAKDSFELDKFLTALDPSLMNQSVEQLREAASAGELSVGWKRGNDLLGSFDLVVQSPSHTAT